MSRRCALAWVVFCTLLPIMMVSAAVIPPAPREGDATQQAKWMREHEIFVQRAQKSSIDLLLLGDSITHRWPDDLWNTAFGSVAAERFGIEGDQVQHLFWRLQNGEFAGLKPKLVVIFIGTNNVPREFSAQDIADSVGEIARWIREQSPVTKILILGMLPRNERPGNIMRDRITLGNLYLAKQDNGDTIRFLDLGGKISTPEGLLTREITPDFLHPNRKGYELIMSSLGPVVREMLGTGGEAKQSNP